MIITDEMIEGAAKAMFCRACTNGDAQRTWDEIVVMPQHGPTVTFYREHAKAALAAGLSESAENANYWRGWIDAIRNADIALQCRGDDRTIRHCRREVLRLVCVSYEPEHVVPMPVWPSDERLVELLSGPTGVPASLAAALEAEAAKKGKRGK